MNHLKNRYRFFRVFAFYLSAVRTQSGEIVPLLFLLAMADAILVYFLPTFTAFEPAFVGTGHSGVIWTALSWAPTTAYVALTARVLFRMAEIPDGANNHNWGVIVLLGAIAAGVQILLLYLIELLTHIPVMQFLVQVLSLFVYPWFAVAISRIMLGDRITTCLGGALSFLISNIWKFIVLAVFISISVALPALIIGALIIVVLVGSPFDVSSWSKRLYLFLVTFLSTAVLPMATIVYLKQVYFPDLPKQKRLIKE